MRIVIPILTLGLAMGCTNPSTPPAAEPLTIAQWKTLPVDEKYTPKTLERLKVGNPSLETPDGWEAFQKTTLAEAKRTDFPKGKR